MKIITPKDWLRDVYIAKRLLPQIRDADGNVSYLYGTPVLYKVNHQPISSTSDIQMYGADAKQVHLGIFVDYPFIDINEFDKAYLLGFTPTGETIVGSKANYTVDKVLDGNRCVLVYFKKLPGLANARI